MSIDASIYSKEGYTCLYPAANQLMHTLDETFKGFLHDLNTEEYHIPSLIDGDILEQCGYFSSFPHQLSVVSHIDSGCCQHVMETECVHNNSLGEDKKYLTPAACLHIYPMLADVQTLTKRVITTKAKVYRFEDTFTDLSRLWEFTVREIVFIGPKDFVKNLLEEIKKKALEFAKTITEKAIIVKATDNFYPSLHNKVKAKIQKANDLKYELIVPLKREDVAVTSFNYHHTHFSKAFNFDQHGKVVTGCVGFGIERWIAICYEYNHSLTN